MPADWRCPPQFAGYSRYAAQQMLSAEIEIVFVIVAGILLVVMEHRVLVPAATAGPFSFTHCLWKNGRAGARGSQQGKG